MLYLIIYIYSCFYPKWLTEQSMYTFIYISMGFKPMVWRCNALWDELHIVLSMALWILVAVLHHPLYNWVESYIIILGFESFISELKWHYFSRLVCSCESLALQGSGRNNVAPRSNCSNDVTKWNSCSSANRLLTAASVGLINTLTAIDSVSGPVCNSMICQILVSYLSPPYHW